MGLKGFEPHFARNSTKSGFIQHHFTLQAEIFVRSVATQVLLYTCQREVSSPQDDSDLSSFEFIS